MTITQKWKWDAVPAGQFVYGVKAGHACPACGAPVALTYEETDLGGTEIGNTIECTSCAWAQGSDVHGFLWARRAAPVG